MTIRANKLGVLMIWVQLLWIWTGILAGYSQSWLLYHYYCVRKWNKRD